jgi:hypothetical protein
MKKILFIFFATIFIVSLSGCGNSNRWSLFVYPNGEQSEKSINTLNSYNSFEECEAGFEFDKKTFPNASFECGYKCKTQAKRLDLYICDETRDI